MSRPVSKILIAVAALALVLCAALVLLRPGHQPAQPPMPNPNGYTELVRAGHLLTSEVGMWTTMDAGQLREVLARNADALKLARAALEHPCRVPLDLAATNAGIFPDLAGLKALAQTFAAEGRLALLENRPPDAACSCLNAIRAGHASMRGGLIISMLVGVAMEAIGMNCLEKVIPTLDAKTCRETLAALEEIDAKREPLETVRAQERAYMRRAYGIKGQLMLLVNFRHAWDSRRRELDRVQKNQLRARQLMVNLAARACELEKGVRPRQISELVPTYLKAIPLDPTTGMNLNYRF